ncbi:MAG: HAD family hydrolase [Kiritimatiellia bacterium]
MIPALIPLPRVILFDLDDTIVAYDAASEGCWREACTRYADQISGVTPDELCVVIQRQSEWFWSDAERFRQGRLNLAEARRQVVSGALATLGLACPEAARAIAHLRTELHEQRIAPFPGAIAVLQQLHAAGIRLGMVTNGSSDKQRAKINRYQLTPFFDCIVVEGEFGCGKPDDRVFRHALSQLKADPAETWMVGDNLRHDIAPAQALGVTGIWHDFRGKGLPADAPCQPRRIIRQLTELLLDNDAEQALFL